MPITPLDTLLAEAKRRIDRVYSELLEELKHIAEDAKRRRLAEVEEAKKRLVEELKRLAG